MEASQYRTLCWKLEIQKLGQLDSEVLKTAIALIKDWIEASLFLEASTLRTQLIEEFQIVENPSAEQTKQSQRLQTTIVPSSDIQ